MHDTPLAPLLDLTPVDDGARFGCEPLVFERRLLGGGVIAAATLAAARTLRDPSGYEPAALDITFCRAGVAGAPLDIEVRNVHDGATTAVRHATALQGDRTIAVATVRFQATRPDDGGPPWEPSTTRDAAGPDAGSATHAVLATLPLLAGCDIAAEPPAGAGEGRTLHPVWVRIPGVPDEPALHAALIALVTDLGTSTAAATPGTSFRDRIRAVSLDHAIRWHRSARADEWFCVDAAPTVVGHVRSTVGGTVRDRGGSLVASFSQEVFHPPPP